MKKKILLSSIVTIALCLCMIAGSTFALFTDTSDVMNVAVDSGTVDITANLSDLKLYSIKDAIPGEHTGYVENVFDETYFYTTEEVDAFLNGGTANLTNTSLTLTNITPGDKAEFTVSGTNDSNVHTNIRLVVNNFASSTLDGDGVAELPANLEVYFYIGDDLVTFVRQGNSYVSDWIFLNKDTRDFNYTVSIGLPAAAGNDCQAEGVTLDIVLQAVQANEEAPSNNGTVNP